MNHFLKNCLLLLLILIWCAPASITTAQQLEQPVSEDMRERLARLEARMEAEREKLHIPGMALGVVKDGEIIFARGFGVADIENNKPVSPDTLFAIGSSTKAFTATLIGMLDDEGKIDFDDPVRKHLPEFNLKVDTGDEQVTIRDLLCHRTGFTRMSMLWAAGKTNRPEIVQYASRAEPTKGFRETWQYNNVMYMTAGFAAGQAANSTWEELIDERILQPLGMTSSNTSVSLSRQDERLSLGYVWDTDRKEFRQLPMRNLEAIGPAGSINSNIIDMCRWLKFQLGMGEIDGNRLISEDNHADTWTEQITIDGSNGYGLGWMLREWNDKRVVEHGGNIDGFAAQVTMLPEENTGFVLLCNVTASPLQGGSLEIVFDTLLGDPAADSAEPNTDLPDTSKLVGKYRLNFGALRDAELTVTDDNGTLSVDVPGQMAYELKSPDDDGKWYFALTDTIAVSFNQQEDGNVRSLTMHQAGLSVEAPRVGVEMPIEIPLDELRPFLGEYQDTDEGIDVQVIMQNNRLAIDPGGQAPMELLPPDDDGWRKMRANPEVLKIRFNEGDDGSIESLTRTTGTPAKEVTLLRKPDSGDPEDALPSGKELLEKVLHAARSTNPESKGHYKLTGTVNFINQGASGQATLMLSDNGAFRTELDMGNLGYIHESFDGQKAWTDSAFAPFEELAGNKLISAKLRSPLWMAADWADAYDNPSVMEKSTHEDRPVWILRFPGKNKVPDRRLFVDVETLMVVKEETAILVQNIMQLPVTLEYSDYRDVGAFKLPFTISSSNSASGTSLTRYSDSETLSEPPDYEIRPRAETPEQE